MCYKEKGQDGVRENQEGFSGELYLEAMPLIHKEKNYILSFKGMEP